MPAKRGNLARLLVDEYDFSNETSNFTVTLAINEEDCTVLTSTAAEYSGVLAAIAIEQNGYMVNTGEGSMEKELWDRLGVMGSYVAALVGIDNANCPAYVLDNTFGASMEIAAPATSIITLNGSWGQGKGGHRGYRLFDGVLSAPGANPGVDFLNAGQGGEAYLFVRAIAGTAINATLTVSSSTTGASGYVVLGTFTFSGVGSYKITWAGPTNQFLRSQVTSMGGATSITYSVIACVRGVTE